MSIDVFAFTSSLEINIDIFSDLLDFLLIFEFHFLKNSLLLSTTSFHCISLRSRMHQVDNHLKAQKREKSWSLRNLPNYLENSYDGSSENALTFCEKSDALQTLNLSTLTLSTRNRLTSDLDLIHHWILRGSKNSSMRISRTTSSESESL